MNISFKVMEFSSVLGKFAIDAEVLYIENQDMMLGLF